MRRGGWGAWILAAVAPASFLALDPAGWYPFGPAKWAAVSVLVPLGAAGVVWRGRLRADRLLLVAFAALLVCVSVGAVAGVDPWYAWVGTPERELGVWTWVLFALAAFAGGCLDSVEDARALRSGVLVASVGVGAVATAEALGFAPGPVGLGGDRLTGTFGTAAYLGAAAALLLPVAAGTAADRGVGRIERVVGAAGTALLAVACVGAGTRSAWVGLAAAAAVLIVGRRQVLGRHRRTTALVAGLAVVVLALVLVATPAGERISSAFDPHAPGGIGRVDEWRVATRVIAAHPVAGVGPEGYRIAFASGVDDRYQETHGRDPLPDRAHSAPLDVALVGGVGAAAAWLLLAGLILRAAWRAVRRGSPWMVGLAAGLIAHLVGELFLFPTSELDPTAWLLAGFLVAATAPASERWCWTLPRRAAAAGALALGLVAVVSASVASLGLLADREAAVAADHLADGPEGPAVGRAAAATDRRPDVLRYHLLEARARVAADQGTVAGLAAVDAGLRWSPHDPIARLERARLLVARAEATLVPAHADRARRAVEEILDDDPRSADAWRLRAELDRFEGRAAAAERARRRADRLDSAVRRSPG